MPSFFSGFPYDPNRNAQDKLSRFLAHTAPLTHPLYFLFKPPSFLKNFSQGLAILSLCAALFLLSLDSLKRHRDPTTIQGTGKHKETRTALLLSASIKADVTEAFQVHFLARTHVANPTQTWQTMRDLAQGVIFPDNGCTNQERQNNS